MLSSATLVLKWSLQVPSWRIAMRREPRNGQDLSRPSAASRGHRHVEMLEDLLQQPRGGPGCNASHSPQLRESRPHRPEGCLFVRLLPVLASHFQGAPPDPSVGEGTRQALNAQIRSVLPLGGSGVIAVCLVEDGGVAPKPLAPSGPLDRLSLKLGTGEALFVGIRSPIATDARAWSRVGSA